MNNICNRLAAIERRTETEERTNDFFSREQRRERLLIIVDALKRRAALGLLTVSPGLESLIARLKEEQLRRNSADVESAT